MRLVWISNVHEFKPLDWNTKNIYKSIGVRIKIITLSSFPISTIQPQCLLLANSSTSPFICLKSAGNLTMLTGKAPVLSIPVVKVYFRDSKNSSNKNSEAFSQKWRSRDMYQDWKRLTSMTMRPSMRSEGNSNPWKNKSPSRSMSTIIDLRAKSTNSSCSPH